MFTRVTNFESLKYSSVKCFLNDTISFPKKYASLVGSNGTDTCIFLNFDITVYHMTSLFSSG